MADLKDRDDIEFLDEDLAEDFIGEDEAEAFLNEIGGSGDERRIRAGAPAAPEERAKPEQMPEPEEKQEYGQQPAQTPGTAAKAGGQPAADREELYAADREEPRARRSRKRPEEEQDTAPSAVKVPEPSSGKGKGKKTAVIAAGAAVLVLLAGGGAYAAMGQKYNRVFFPNTQINGVDASNKTVEEVELLIAAGIEDYVLTIEGRNGKEETITRGDIKLRSEFDGSLEKLLDSQEPLKWMKYRLNPASHQIQTMVAYDEQAFEETLNSLNCMNPQLMTEPQDARLSEYVSGQGYAIVPENPGDTTEPERVKAAVAEAVMNIQPVLSLEEAGVYKAPAVTGEDAALKALRDEMNKYTGLTVTYKFGDAAEILNGDRIREWLIVNADNTVTIDPAKVSGYVEELSIGHDTYNKAKTLKTSYGPTIKISGGHYGWKINRGAEAEALTAIIKAGESVEREPEYSQKAASRSGNDYGSTYVEMNLTAQHLFFYKDGKLLVESDFVSGNVSKGWTTPPGAFPLTYKQRNATLKGEGYRTPVDYWMPFNGGIGMHDATWRSSFGGAIYKTGGSHGCINLPHGVAKTIYENIAGGMPVLCYNLAGTESAGSASAKPPETTAAPTEAPPQTEAPTQAPEPTQPAPAGPGQSQPQPTQPQPTQPPQQPTQPPQPETTAPAGPGSDTSNTGGAGPGSV